ncbi:hypothetical protein HK100_011081 [Physocladia obscura]|uniref:alpha-galactosidase n=1 Tax=Physocladia obscura TaxID=109957 RepID=A0AAD5T4F6_9FUNG|nr:hypothetical protein HK100_011081 [Physocladia obscura]
MSASVMNASWWQPQLGTGFQYQLVGALNASVPVSVYDVDIAAVDNPVSIAQVRTGNSTRKSNLKICRLWFKITITTVGALETDGSRADQSQFAASDLGNSYPGWPNEVFVDIRSANVRKIMAARFVAMQAAGCDGIEPDNTAFLYTQNTGFSPGISLDDDVAYLRWISAQVHSLGMAVGAKNGGDVYSVQTSLVSLFDFAVVESCAAQSNCDQYNLFVAAEKPVYAVDYLDAGSSDGCGTVVKSVSNACSVLTEHKFEGIVKNCELGSRVFECDLGGALYGGNSVADGNDNGNTTTTSNATATKLSIISHVLSSFSVFAAIIITI